MLSQCVTTYPIIFCISDYSVILIFVYFLFNRQGKKRGSRLEKEIEEIIRESTLTSLLYGLACSLCSASQGRIKPSGAHAKFKGALSPFPFFNPIPILLFLSAIVSYKNRGENSCETEILINE